MRDGRANRRDGLYSKSADSSYFLNRNGQALVVSNLRSTQ